jgi:hypothetical protein
LTVNVNVPAVVGVPVIDSGGDSARPGGSAPAEIEVLYGPTPLETAKFSR